RQGEQDVSSQQRHGRQRPQTGIDSLEQQFLAVEVDAQCKQSANTQCHELDLPPHAPRRRTDGALEVEQNQNRSQQNDELQSAPGPKHRKNPARRVIQHQRARKQLIPIHHYKQRRHYAQRKQQNLRARQETWRIDPSVSKAERNPHDRNKRRHSQQTLVPI